jgi:hypothetical protein
MNKVAMMGLAAGLTGVLASCGGTVTFDSPLPIITGGAVNNAVQLYGLRSEYIDQNNNFVACDNVVSGGTSTSKTSIATYFQISGSVENAEVILIGETKGQTVSARFTKDQLVNVSPTTYKAIATADPTNDGVFLPQSIIVNPTPAAPITIKRVVTDGVKQGSFYAQVTATNEFGTRTNNSRDAGVRSINVYASCTLSGTTNSTL